MFFWRKKEEGSEAVPRGQERWFFFAPPPFPKLCRSTLPFLHTPERDAFANFLANTLQRRSEGGAAQSAKSATPFSSRGVVGWGWGRTKTGFGSSAREDDHKGQAKKRDDDDSPVGKDCKKWGGGC